MIASETRTRSIAKAVTWRIAATLITAAVAYLLTGSIGKAASIGMLDSAVKLLAFYGHERLWLLVPLGRV